MYFGTRPDRLLSAAGLGLLLLTVSPTAHPGSLHFVESAPGNYDYVEQTTIPGTFGAAEFTLEVWVRPDNSFPVGATTPGTPGQLANWSDADPAPYSGADWWYPGNFLLDGHNNNAFSDGTFSLQFYGRGRVRWDFGDGATPTGGTWAVQASPAELTPALLDDGWHSIACVRRWSGATSAQLELWIDGARVDTEVSDRRTNMRAEYWNTWTGFPLAEPGWFWGAEKRVAVDPEGATQYEDYKGLVDEIRFWSRAKTEQELTEDWETTPTGIEPGLDGWFRFDEESGSSTCDEISSAECWSFINTTVQTWSTADAPPAPGPNPEYVYLDFGAPAGGNGTQASPFNTLGNAVAAAAVGATIEIAPGTGTEAAVVATPLTLIKETAAAGLVQLGASAGRSNTGARSGFVSAPPR